MDKSSCMKANVPSIKVQIDGHFSGQRAFAHAGNLMNCAEERRQQLTATATPNQILQSYTCKHIQRVLLKVKDGKEAILGQLD
jgi:hypothetical protein